MSRQTLGPFPELRNLPPIDVATAGEIDILDRMYLLNTVLREAGCNCNGNAKGRQRDPYFGGDISELVSRASPHEIYSMDEAGLSTSQVVAVDLATLQVEIDDNRELCVWLYAEPEV